MRPRWSPCAKRTARGLRPSRAVRASIPGFPGSPSMAACPGSLPTPAVRGSCVASEVLAGVDPCEYSCFDWRPDRQRRCTGNRCRQDHRVGTVARPGRDHRASRGTSTSTCWFRATCRPTPDFQLAVGTATGGVYATQRDPARLDQPHRRFCRGVTTFEFDGLGSGIAGSFIADPASADRPQPAAPDSGALRRRRPGRLEGDRHRSGRSEKGSGLLSVHRSDVSGQRGARCPRR